MAPTAALPYAAAMPLLTESLAPWHDFYTLLAEASATMIGLLFVAASVGGAVFSQSKRGAVRMFLSASVVQFATILASCMVVVAPFRDWAWFGGAIAGCGGFGLAYSAMAWRDTMAEGLYPRLDLEDRCWYAFAPVFGYLLEAGAGIALIVRPGSGHVALAVAVATLLAVAVHNAWDITVWSVTRRKE